jgi:hypothetical protein
MLDVDVCLDRVKSASRTVADSGMSITKSSMVWIADTVAKIKGKIAVNMTYITNAQS